LRAVWVQPVAKPVEAWIAIDGYRFAPPILRAGSLDLCLTLGDTVGRGSAGWGTALLLIAGTAAFSFRANKHHQHMRFVRTYSLEQDHTRIEAMQKASLGATNFGLSPVPALAGTPEWWRATQDGSLARGVVSGTISRAYWGSMGDWPMCEVTANDGSKSTWTREGDIARYVEGLQVQFTFVLHPWKVPDQYGLGAASKIVLMVDIEDSDRRSDPRAPGPGGVGLRMK
jgi:hypothetical protein